MQTVSCAPKNSGGVLRKVIALPVVREYFFFFFFFFFFVREYYAMLLEGMRTCSMLAASCFASAPNVLCARIHPDSRAAD